MGQALYGSRTEMDRTVWTFCTLDWFMEKCPICQFSVLRHVLKIQILSVWTKHTFTYHKFSCDFG
jgi:hypothetical protein